jgi:hypothetical protein
MGKPYENGYVRYQYDSVDYDAGHAGNPVDDCCPVLQPQFPVGIWRPESFIRRSRDYTDGMPYFVDPLLMIGRGCDVAKSRIENTLNTPYVLWRWRERIFPGPQPSTKEHISCRITSESIITIEPTLLDSVFPTTPKGTNETEIIWEQLYTLAEAAGLPAPFPQSCLAP